MLKCYKEKDLAEEGGMNTTQSRVNNERRQILRTLEGWLEVPLLVLGFLWLALLIIEYVWGERPWLATTSDFIWIIFIADFVVKFALSPDKLKYLKGNWLTLIALALPALR